MEYNITRDTLQNNLLYDTLKALSKVMYDLQFRRRIVKWSMQGNTIVIL